MNYRQVNQQRNFQDNKIKKIALSMGGEGDFEKYNEYCDKIDRYVKESLKKVSMTQVRRIYNKLRKIEEIRDLVRQRPLLLYLGARNSNTLTFVRTLDDIIKNIKNHEELKSFKEFLQAIVAYKKSYEKGDN